MVSTRTEPNRFNFTMPNSAMTSSLLQPALAATPVTLAEIVSHRLTTIIGLAEPTGAEMQPMLLQRLAELGFIAGEEVCVLHRGPGGREPIAVQVGDTVFALRLYEANCILVKRPE